MSDRGPDDWWDQTRCFNVFSTRQQTTLLEHGYLAFPWRPETDDGCQRSAEVGVECKTDRFPGPRFYCYPCAVEYLNSKAITAA